MGNETVLSLMGYDRRALVGGLESEEWYVVQMSAGNWLGEGVSIRSAPVLSHSMGKSPCWLEIAYTVPGAHKRCKVAPAYGLLAVHWGVMEGERSLHEVLTGQLSLPVQEHYLPWYHA